MAPAREASGHSAVTGPGIAAGEVTATACLRMTSNAWILSDSDESPRMETRICRLVPHVLFRPAISLPQPGIVPTDLRVSS